MAAVLVHFGAVRSEHLPDQQPELAVAQHGYRRAPGNPNLVQDLAGRRHRLGEDRLLGGYGIRHSMQVPLRQAEVLGKRPRMAYNSENAPARAVPAESSGAPVAVSTRQVDLSHDASSDPRGGVRRDYLADKLVPGPAAKAVIAALQLEVT